MFQPKNSLVQAFINPDGSFQPSICADEEQNIQIPFQRHVDIRTFFQDDIKVPWNQFDLDFFDQTFLNTQTQMELEADNEIVIDGDNWTAGAVGPQPAFNNQSGIQLTCTGSATTTTSSYTPHTKIDIVTGFGDYFDLVSLACPSLPLADLDLTQCFLDLSSDPGGSFSSSTASVAFSDGFLNPTGGDYEIGLLRSLFTGADLTAITAVRLRIFATTTCVFRCNAIRMLPPTWKAAVLDTDTRRSRLVSAVSRTGNVSDHQFPTADLSDISNDPNWPMLFAQPTGSDQVYNIDHSIRFYTGANGNSDFVWMTYRAVPANENTQSHLETMTMADLNGMVQPDFQTPVAVPDLANNTALSVVISWGSGGGQALLFTDGPTEYTYTPVFAAHSYYVAFVTVKGRSVRLRIYGCDQVGNVNYGDQVLDTLVVTDPELVRDGTGLVGWYALLGDGDSAIYGINASYTAYSKYKSNPLRSQTPVIGASLYTEGSSNVTLAGGLLSSPYGGTVSIDTSRSPTAYKVQMDSAHPLEGAATEPFWVYDWSNTVVEFSLFAPGNIVNQPLVLFLLSPNLTIYQLTIPFYTINAWQNYSLSMANSTLLTGYYTLFFAQPGVSSSAYWVDHFQVYTRSFEWKIRGHGDDYHDDDTTDWVYFEDAVGQVNMGASLRERDLSIIVAGHQLQSDATLEALQIVPYYNDRSKLVWSDQALPEGGFPDAIFIVTDLGP